MCCCITLTLVAGLLARSRYSESPATGHLGTGFSWFPCVYKQMLRWFPRLQVATTCFSCSPPKLNLLDPYFIFMYMHNNHCHQVVAHLQLNIIIIIIIIMLIVPPPPNAPTCPCGLCGLPSWAWRKCNRLLRLGCP